MNELIIRRAAVEDAAPILALCALLDPADYALEAWPLWLETEDAVNLVALKEGSIVGCWHGERLTPFEAWSQGTRVHPEFHRQGIGSRMLAAFEAELRKLGMDVIRGSIGTENSASLRLIEKAGWRVHTRVCRRELDKTIKEAGLQLKASLHPASAGAALALSRRFPLLASRSHLARFRRAYFAMTEEYLENRVEEEAVFISADGLAFAILERERRAGSEKVWAIGLGGKESGIISILKNLSAKTQREGLVLVVDSPDELLIQRVLDDLDFNPPGPDDRYVIVEHRF